METQTTNSSNGSFQKTGPLTYDDAIAALLEGKTVKLPEWTGYWIIRNWYTDNVPLEKNLENIEVLTKSGEFLSSPWIETYKDRNDWQISDGLLGFDWAINALKNGKTVRRKGWNGKGMFIFMRPEDSLNIRTVVEKVKSLPNVVKRHYDKQDDRVNPGEFGLADIKFNAYLCMKAANGEIVNGWLASQTDMLAEDWELAE